MILRFAFELMSCLVGASLALNGPLAADQDRQSGRVEIVSVQKIWDGAPHNAFTDLIFYDSRWFCVFREGKAHVSPDGRLRVITSRDGKTWESAALISADDADLRDAKITVTPDGRLMLSGAGAMHDYSVHKIPGAHSHESFVWFSVDGKKWTKRQRVGELNDWLWRISWHRGIAYGVGYHCGPDSGRGTSLYHSGDGTGFQKLVDDFQDDGYTNESSILFTPSGTAYCLLRRDRSDHGGSTALWGTSLTPYREWTWQDMNVRIGGPHMIRSPDGRLIAAVRLYDQPVRTALCLIDAESGQLTEIKSLPSGGDTSYAGMVWKDNLLWVSYYSSHEGKTSIYLAKIQL